MKFGLVRFYDVICDVPFYLAYGDIVILVWTSSVSRAESGCYEHTAVVDADVRRFEVLLSVAKGYRVLCPVRDAASTG